jgi:protein-tyrosine-phosphatase
LTTKILTVCHANRFRSPLAEVFLKRYPHLEVRSAGFQRSGLRAGKPVREAARRLGFDLETHRSTELSQELVDWADYVILMNPTQLDRLAGGFFLPHDQKQTVLGRYLSQCVEGIPDLGFIRGGTPEFDRVVSMIKDATENLAKCLKPKPSTKSLRSSRSAGD